MDGAPNPMQRIDQGCEIVDGWFATCYYDKFSFGFSDLCRQCIDRKPFNFIRNIIWMPSPRRVAPGTMNGTPKSAYEISCPPCVYALALEGVKLFVNR